MWQEDEYRTKNTGCLSWTGRCRKVEKSMCRTPGFFALEDLIRDAVFLQKGHLEQQDLDTAVNSKVVCVDMARV